MKNKAHEGFEVFFNGLQMSLKMIFILLLVAVLLHVVLSATLIFLDIKMEGLKVVLFWLFSKALHWMQISINISFPNPAGSVVQTTTDIIVNSPAIEKYAVSCLSRMGEIIFLLCSIYLLVPVLVLFFKKKSVRQVEDEYIRGSKLITIPELERQIKENGDKVDLPFGGPKMPISAENRASMVVGRPGTGKTAFLMQLLARLKERSRTENIKVIIYDFKGDFCEKFFEPEKDLLFNPLDKRSIGWNLFNEIKNIPDFTAIASSQIPLSISNQDPFWPDAARALFSSILIYLYKNDLKSNEEIWKMLTDERKRIAKNLEHMDEAKKGYRFIEDSASKQAMSVFATLMQYTQSFEYMPGLNSNFSLQSWLEKEESSFLFLTNTVDAQDALKPILSLFIDLLARKLLSLPDSQTRRIFFLLDEFPTLHRLPSLVSLLTLSRSKGGCPILGAQDFTLIDEIYGERKRKSIINAMSNYAIFAINDPDTSDYCSRLIGDAEYKEADLNISMGVEDFKDGKSFNFRTKKEPIFLPSEIRNFPELQCVAKFSGYNPVFTKLKYIPYPVKNKPFEIRENLILDSKGTT